MTSPTGPEPLWKWLLGTAGILGVLGGTVYLWRHYLLVNVWPVAFTILEPPAAQRRDAIGGVEFSVKVRILRRTDENIERVNALVGNQLLDLIHWEGQPPQGKIQIQTLIFGIARPGKYHKVKLKVVMRGRLRGKKCPVRKTKISEDPPVVVST